MIFKKDVFMSWKYFPIGWNEALQQARKNNYEYIDFNGYVFYTNNDELDYNNALCKREDLINKVWFTSDTHFNSERTLELSKRPFKTVEEMNNVLIKNWNSVVG